LSSLGVARTIAIGAATMTGLASVLLLASVAGPPALEWRAPDGCPTAADVQQSLGALAGHADLEHVRARGVIRRVGAQYELRLEVHTARVHQSRSLRADACGTLGEAAALLIAIVVDPVEVAAQLATEPPTANPRELDPEAPLAVITPEIAPPASEPPTAPSEPSPPPVRPPAATAPRAAPSTPSSTAPLRARRRARDISLFVRPEAALDAFAAPSITVDAVGALGLLLPRLRLELHGMYSAARPIVFNGERYGTLARWAVGARACGRLVRSVLEVPLCAGLEGRRLLLSDPHITITDKDPSLSWLTMLVGLGVVWSPHPRVGIGARTEFVVAPWRASFFNEDQEQIDYTQPLNIRFALGVEVRFGPGARRDGSAANRPQSKMTP
jgi:hypothetical protein